MLDANGVRVSLREDPSGQALASKVRAELPSMGRERLIRALGEAYKALPEGSDQHHLIGFLIDRLADEDLRL